jgi:hypothetical protein
MFPYHQQECSASRIRSQQGSSVPARPVLWQKIRKGRGSGNSEKPSKCEAEDTRRLQSAMERLDVRSLHSEAMLAEGLRIANNLETSLRRPAERSRSALVVTIVRSTAATYTQQSLAALFKSDRVLMASLPTPRVVVGPPTYELHSLGWKAFQQLCVSVAAEVWGQTVQGFFDSHDGGRDRAFYGTWTSTKGDMRPSKAVSQCSASSRRSRAAA